MQEQTTLGQASLGDPDPKDLEFVFASAFVARHGPILDSLKNQCGVGFHVVIRPEVEGKFHRSTIFYTKQQFDVISKVQLTSQDRAKPWRVVRSTMAYSLI